MELPGKVAGKIKITLTGGESVDNEFSTAEFVEGEIDETQLTKYYIEEIKQ